MVEINFTPFPDLTTERLTLRQLTNEDENEIFKLRSDERVNRFIARSGCESIDEARKFISNINNGIGNNEWIYWAIVLKNHNKLIGTICIWNILKEHYRAEVGYELHPDFQGRGLMQEALTIVIDYCFNNMKLHSIAANVSPDNLHSIKILERNNFVKEAYFKEDFFFSGEFLDTAVYSLRNQTGEKY